MEIALLADGGNRSAESEITACFLVVISNPRLYVAWRNYASKFTQCM
jgi:hypothetical protein